MMTLRSTFSLVLALTGASLAQAQAVPPEGPAAPDAAPTQAVEPGAPLAVKPGVEAQTSAPPPEPAPTAATASAGSDASASAWDYLDQGATADGNNAAPTPEELAALTAPSEEQERFPKLDIYGFADFTYWHPLMKKDSSWRFFNPSKSTFWMGNINLYVASQMSETLRSLLEVRFTYLPQGKNRSGIEQTGQPYVDTSANDYADGDRPMKLGAIEIERVQLEYAPLEWLSVVVGQWLTPYGIWNVDHGSPTTIDPQKPYVVGEAYIPERQTGILIQGSVRRGVHRLTYHLGLSNGRGPLDSYYDYDNNKAGTLHLSWASNSSAGDITLGASGYMGRYTNLQKSPLPKPQPNGDLLILGKEDIIEQYDEISAGVDAKWIKGGFQAFTEFLVNQRRYTKAGRPALLLSSLDMLDPLPQKRIQPDLQRYGGYLITGYRFKWLGVMPYTQFQFVRLGSPDLPKTASASVGLNIRPHESITLKTHWAYGWFPGADDRGIGRDGIQVLESQVAWAF